MTALSPESPNVPFDWRACIEAARAGSASALGRLLEACRPLLLVIAERELDADLRAKVSPSDLVQETFLGGFPAFSRFIGETEEEVRAWLFRILHNKLADLRDHYQQAAKRQVSREHSLDGGSADHNAGLADSAPSPSSLARRHEEQERVEAALVSLSEDHRRVIYLRHREHLSFAEIGRIMGRAEDAVQKLWARAIQKLREALGTKDS
ncbi:MAG TPA: sigma-70 family RNA polymerase sigma factor [Gemmataceae bacterium]|nr:sigma-70 family RNA polymerase sigma factor [Gemmataceae bacterium]